MFNENRMPINTNSHKKSQSFCDIKSGKGSRNNKPNMSNNFNGARNKNNFRQGKRGQ